MTTRAWLKAAVLWAGILLLAMLNGLLRESLLVPALGSAAGLVASGLVLSACILAVAFAAAPWFGRMPSRRWLWIGSCWLVLTLVFEWSFGRWVQHKSWSELAGAYAFSGGNLWPAVLVVTFLSPWLAARIRGLT